MHLLPSVIQQASHVERQYLYMCCFEMFHISSICVLTTCPKKLQLFLMFWARSMLVILPLTWSFPGLMAAEQTILSQ